MAQVWCANIFGNMSAFATYECLQSTSEERQTLMQFAARNRFGHELSAEDFPSRITSMDTPPRQLKPYAFISGRIPMVSPTLADLLKGLDIGRSAEDDDLAVTADALNGADFWVESKFSDTVFFSARFEKLMSENGLRDLIRLKSVRVV
ncbi:MAG: hypothetical protein ACRBB0_00085 [Pelagimonas sp.]|uniref:hypothetical protein n=1 Tax=Pelagimonas sp. TaxID=2073170 RepID=UPI003D6A6571